MNEPLVSIVTAHCNTPDWIELFVKSVRRFTADVPHEILVIDNDSLEVNKRWLREQPDVRMIEVPQLSHGGAMDIGTRGAWGRYVCILDSDVHIQRTGWVQDLIALYHENDKTRLIGCVGPKHKPLHPPLFFFERDFIVRSNISWQFIPDPAVPTQTDTAQQAYWDILALGYEVLRLPKGPKIYEDFIGDEIWIAGKPTIAHMWYGTRFQENGLRPKLELDGYKLIDHIKNKRSLFAQPFVREILGNDRTAIIITTFMRDALLVRCVESIRKFYPDIPIFVGDNGNPDDKKTEFLKAAKCAHFQLPFDLGVSGVRNETLKLIPPEYEYLMIIEDDTVFTDKTQVEKLRAVLDDEPAAGLCGCLLFLKDGREQHYEGKVYSEGTTHFIKKIDSPRWRKTASGVQFTTSFDLILNIFMMRRQVWIDNPWDTAFKTALEHEDFFLGLQQKTKWRVAYTHDVSLQHLPEGSNDYKKYRCRPVGWKLFGEKWGVQYVNSDYNLESPLSYEAMAEGKVVDLKGDCLKFAIDVLSANQCTWWLEAGTCLGAIRERGFITHDSDIDIGLHPKELALWDKLHADMIAAGFEFLRAWTHGKKRMELSFRKNGVKIDLFFFYDDGDFWWHGAFGPNKDGGWDHDWEFLPHVFSAHLFKDLKPVTFHNLPCFLPNPPERYLLERYGSTWKQRQRGYRFWTDCRAIDRNYFKRGTKVVFIGGVWDLFHEGHLAILERAKALGTKLIVGVLTDKAASDYKAQPVIPFEARRRIVDGLKCVDKTIVQNDRNSTADLEAASVQPHYLVHGDDWDQCPGETYVRKHGGKLVYLPYTQGISTTEIRQRILDSEKLKPTFRENKLAVGIKTFMRDAAFFKTMETYQTTLAKIDLPYRFYIADDGPQNDERALLYTKLKQDGHMVISLPFNSGISFGRNAIVKQAKEDYVLISDDDVVIRDAVSIKNMKAVLDSDEKIGLVAATLRYEKGAFFAGENYAKGIRLERRGKLLARTPAPREVHATADGIKYVLADQVPNIFLAKRQLFKDVMWDNRIKIEFEHIDFFLELQKTTWKAAVCLDAEAFHLITAPEEGYNQYRRTTPMAYFLQKHELGSVVNQF